MHVNCFMYSLWYLCHITTICILLLSSFSWIAGIQGQEMSRRRTSNVCQNNSECPINASCDKFNVHSSTGQCVCPHGYIIVAENRQRDCYKAATTIGDTCVYNEQCMITLSTESECLHGRCQCQSRAHFVQRKNTCYKSVRVGGFCTFSNNCIGEDTVCRSGVCHCPYGKHPRYDMIECIPDVKLNEKCNSDEECVTDEAQCNGGICQCKPNFVMSKDGDKCLKVAKRLHDECEEDQQCTELLPFTKCDIDKNFTCICKEGHHEMNYKCWVSVPLGGICEADENCAGIDYAICKNDKCICHDGFKELRGYCSSGFEHFKNFNMSQRILVLIIMISYYLF